MSKSFDTAAQTNEFDENDTDVDTMASGTIFERFPSQIGSTPTPTPTGAAFMKICLHESDDMLLFENNSYSLLRDGSGEAEAIANDNQHYEDTMKTTAKQRRMHDIETQTVDAHCKARASNTDHINKSSNGTFVSNYDMYDTFTNLQTVTEHIPIDYNDRHDQLDITTYVSKSDNDASSSSTSGNKLTDNKAFQVKSMVLQRALAANVFHDEQRRFRCFEQTDAIESNRTYLYRIKLLYRYKYHGTSGSSVSCMAWCPQNTDILAIGYGIFKCQTSIRHEHSAVCLWNIKVCDLFQVFLLYTISRMCIASFTRGPPSVRLPLSCSTFY